jgi:hypothetical protein
MSDIDSQEPSSNIPSSYFNGFQLGLSNADVTCMLLQNGLPTMSLNMSYTTAKTLSVVLSDMIATLEKVTERKIMTLSEVSAGLEKLETDDAKNDAVH